MSEMQEQERIPQIVEGAKGLLKDAKTYIAIGATAGLAMVAPNVGTTKVDTGKIGGDNVPGLDLGDIGTFPEGTNAGVDAPIESEEDVYEGESKDTLAEDVTDEVDSDSVSDEELVAIDTDCDEGELIAIEEKDPEWVPEGPRWDGGVEGEDPEWVASQAATGESVEGDEVDEEGLEIVDADSAVDDSACEPEPTKKDFEAVEEKDNKYEIEEVDFEKEKKETSAPVIKPEWLPAEEAPAENVQNNGENGSDEKPKDPVIVTDPAEAFEGQPEGQTDAGESTTTITEGGKGGVVEESETQSEETETSEDGVEKETPAQGQTVAPATAE